MRKRNWRLVIFGLILTGLGFGFFIFMGTTLAARSTDPVQFMSLIGQVSGVVVGISAALIIAGLIGKKV